MVRCATAARWEAISDGLENLPREKVIGTVLNAIDELPAKKYSYSKYQYNKYYS